MQKKPDWLRAQALSGPVAEEVQAVLSGLHLNTVCMEAACPNCGECFNKKTATFMILGRRCTRNCTFCNVQKETPDAVDEEEPKRVAKAVQALGLRHVVVTSVTRDDLEDGGASHFVKVIEEIRTLQSTNTIIEVLIPDFQGDENALLAVVNAKPDIINHNVETVPRLYGEVRPMAQYARSLALLQRVKQIDKSRITKSGFMVGLGETEEEILQVLQDLRQADCDMLTVGQYLAPSKAHHPVVAYIHPDVFEKYRKEALNMGFLHVASGPLVRSSYMAEQDFHAIGFHGR